MFKKIFLSLFILLSVFFLGCSPEKGEATVEFEWDVTPTSFSDNNPAIPKLTELVQGEKYQSEEGTFSFSYTSNEILYQRQYEVTFNSASYVPIPKAGENLEIKIFLNTQGPTIQKSYPENPTE